MGKSWDLLRDFMLKRLQPHGAVSAFCRTTGFSRSGVDQWLRDESAPSIKQIDKIADALGVPPWELLRPEGAQPRVERVEHHLAECYRRVAEDAGKRAQAPAPEPRAADAAGEDLLVEQIRALSPDGRKQAEVAIKGIAELEKAKDDRGAI